MQGQQAHHTPVVCPVAAWVLCSKSGSAPKGTTSVGVWLLAGVQAQSNASSASAAQPLNIPIFTGQT